ncbi:recombinase family protein [Streptomyces sp. NPDC006514]|uniref:recombinase family protein n=1 Tax=Streptomyces sp. NPDC006514 TaxID=3154308 RepID=UPI0033A02035
MHVTTRAILAPRGHPARDLVPTDLGSHGHVHVHPPPGEGGPGPGRGPGRGSDQGLQGRGKVFKGEDKSGFHTYVNRPDWEAALTMLRERLADVLIVFKVDRATRQGIPQASEIIRIVYETGCRFISIADGIDSNNEGWEIQLTLAAHQAHKESKNTSIRVTDLRADERDEGRWMGSRRTASSSRRNGSSPLTRTSRRSSAPWSRSSWTASPCAPSRSG